MIVDLRIDTEAAAAFEQSWGFDPVANGKFFGVKRTINGKVSCQRAWTTKASAERANRGGR